MIGRQAIYCEENDWTVYTSLSTYTLLGEHSHMDTPAARESGKCVSGRVSMLLKLRVKMCVYVCMHVILILNRRREE